MKGSTEESTGITFWVIFAIVTIAAFFVIAHFIYNQTLPIDIGTVGGLSTTEDYVIGCKDAAKATIGDVKCRECGKDFWKMCEQGQSINFKDLMGGVVSDTVDVCVISSAGRPVETVVSYDGGSKKGSIDAVGNELSCTTVLLGEPRFVTKVSADAGITHNLDRLYVTVHVYRESIER